MSRAILVAASTMMLAALAPAIQAQSPQQEADRMVRAQGVLMKSLDADKAGPGTEFRVQLTRTADLTNGQKLPVGTVLIGRVAGDDSQISGQSKLALRFTEAEVKGHQTIPIRATIVGFTKPELRSASDDYYKEEFAQPNNGWTKTMLSIDQLHAVPHVDLHSKIAGTNSGVFVSTDEKDFKLSAGSEFQLAIAGANGSDTARTDTK